MVAENHYARAEYVWTFSVLNFEWDFNMSKMQILNFEIDSTRDP